MTTLPPGAGTALVPHAAPAYPSAPGAGAPGPSTPDKPPTGKHCPARPHHVVRPTSPHPASAPAAPEATSPPACQLESPSSPSSPPRPPTHPPRGGRAPGPSATHPRLPRPRACESALDRPPRRETPCPAQTPPCRGAPSCQEAPRPGCGALRGSAVAAATGMVPRGPPPRGWAPLSHRLTDVPWTLIVRANVPGPQLDSGGGPPASPRRTQAPTGHGRSLLPTGTARSPLRGRTVPVPRPSPVELTPTRPPQRLSGSFTVNWPTRRTG